jgi:hypothetical protein
MNEPNPFYSLKNKITDGQGYNFYLALYYNGISGLIRYILIIKIQVF